MKIESNMKEETDRFLINILNTTYDPNPNAFTIKCLKDFNDSSIYAKFVEK